MVPRRAPRHTHVGRHTPRRTLASAAGLVNPATAPAAPSALPHSNLARRPARPASTRPPNFVQLSGGVSHRDKGTKLPACVHMY
jgi:hypothetical protein